MILNSRTQEEHTKSQFGGVMWMGGNSGQTLLLLRSSVRNRGPNFVELRRMFKFSLIIRWFVSYERPILPAMSKIIESKSVIAP